MIFIETPVFTAQIKELLSDDDYGAFQRYLTENPEAGESSRTPADYARSVWRRRVTARAGARE